MSDQQSETTARLHELTREDVEFMPERKEPGILYVSERFALAIHLCACGRCGNETVTPLDGDGWTLTERATLRPSIGNWQFPCRSHYFITEGRVQWL